MIFPALTETREASRPRLAFSVLEMLVVLASLILFLGFGAVIIVGVVQVQRTDTEVFQRVLAQSALADRFREDVARARAALDQLGDHSAGPGCLILRLGENHHVIYRWQEKELRRLEMEKDLKASQALAVGGEKSAVEFLRSAEGKLIILRLSGEQGHNDSRRPMHLDIAAALGGDWR